MKLQRGNQRACSVNGSSCRSQFRSPPSQWKHRTLSPCPENTQLNTCLINVFHCFTLKNISPTWASNTLTPSFVLFKAEEEKGEFVTYVLFIDFFLCVKMIFVDNKLLERYFLHNKCTQQTNQSLAFGILRRGVLDPDNHTRDIRHRLAVVFFDRGDATK